MYHCSYNAYSLVRCIIHGTFNRGLNQYHVALNKAKVTNRDLTSHNSAQEAHLLRVSNSRSYALNLTEGIIGSIYFWQTGILSVPALITTTLPNTSTMAPAKLPPIALFGYDSSPFTRKVQLTLRLLQVPYSFLVVPSMMPRPILVDNFNLTYRKIPVLAIGRDVIVDTSLIVEYLHAHPALKAWRDERQKTRSGQTAQEVHQDARGRVLSRLLSSFFTDRPLFRLTTGLIPHVVWRTKFGEDRAGLIGHKLDPDKLEKKVPRNLVSLDTYLSIIEPMFGEGGWVLGGQEPTLADVSLYYQLEWGRTISRGIGIQDLTGGGTADGMGEGMEGVFNRDRYPGLLDWYGRFESFLNGLPVVEERIEKGDAKAVEGVMRRLQETARSEEVSLLATPNGRLAEKEDSLGVKYGAKVSIAPDDTGRGDPTVGTLIAASPEELVIEPDLPEVVGKEGTKATVDGIRLHFPRVGFTVSPVRAAKL